MRRLTDGAWSKQTLGLTYGAASIVLSKTARVVQRPSIRRQEVGKTTQRTFAAQLTDVRTASNRRRENDMSKYEFSLVLKGPLDLTEEFADKLFACGCDDGSPGTCNGVFSVDFHREASSLEAAINSAIQNVRDAGHDVEQVQIEPNAMPQSA